MIKSMTGFASVTREDEHATISVAVRSLNHRFLDLQLRLPQALAAIESDLRALVSRYIARGRVEVMVSLQRRQAPRVEVEFSEEFGRALETALVKARALGLVAGALTPGDLLRVPHALAIRETPAEADAGRDVEVVRRVRETTELALVDLDSMRVREGGHLGADLGERCARVAAIAERIAIAADEGRAAMEARLSERVQQLRIDLQADEVAVAQEIVRTAARSDISEEIARFRGHVAHWSALAEAAEPCGRKLEFLLQEMNREVNTMGSKADGLQVSELIIGAKAELEKMREQVQNVE